MKRIILPLLSLLLLCGCSLPFSNEYIYIEEHNEAFAYKEQSEPAEQIQRTVNAKDYISLRNAITEFIMEGVENGWVTFKNENGDLTHSAVDPSSYIADLYRYTETNALIAYAIDTIRFEAGAEDGVPVLKMQATYREPTLEILEKIKSMETVRGKDDANERFMQAMEQFQPSLTLQVSGYSDDFSQSLDEYCIRNPQLLPEVPEIKTELYPDTGNVRVIEAQFDYRDDIQKLREHRRETLTVLSDLYNHVRAGNSLEEKLALTASYLSRQLDNPHASDGTDSSSESEAGNDPLFTYDLNASVYSLLSSRGCNSRCFVSVLCYLCKQLEIDCRVVHGTYNGEDRYWCIVSDKDQFRHVDLYRACVELPVLSVAALTDDEMEGYEWKREDYPSCISADTEEPDTE